MSQVQKPHPHSGQLDRLRRVWERLGGDDPLWAVLSDSRKRGGRWDIDEFFAKWGWSTSAFTGNSNGDPLRDIFWDGSEALCKCDETCGDKYGCDYDRDCDNDWGYKDSCFGSYSWSSWRC